MKEVVFIFDFDGVMVETLAPLYQIYCEFLQQFNVKGTHQEFDHLNGPKLAEIVAYLKKQHNLNKPHDELLSLYQNKLALLYQNTKPNDGLEAILKQLASHQCTIALASSGKRVDIEAFLNRHHLSGYFDLIVTGDDVEHAKPSPEIYNRVKQYYPGKVYYVVEDSQNGLKSAIAANMKTLWYNPRGQQTALKTDYRITSLSQIKNIIVEVSLSCFTIAKSTNIHLQLVEHEPQIDNIQQQAIDDLWRNRVKKNSLFNGKIVCYKSHKQTDGQLTIECFITQYKYFYSQLKAPNLGLNITPIGVSGIIIDEDNNTLVGIRHKVTEYADCYELIPAGSIDPVHNTDGIISFEQQLTTEFVEETQLKTESIAAITPLCLIFDKTHGVYDICCSITPVEPIADLLKTSRNDEYNTIKIIKLADIKQQMAVSKWVPAATVIVNNLDLTP